ncbi:MAG: glycosyltransferase family 39 protein, partial [Candidatus Promineofilum sp.]|nr:glycosyltransferase family 39 protein [Promineifilum sp.]
MLLLAVGLAAVLRFYRLGEWPPGPYRDEAYNALDALGVLRGQHALFFPANNGREPLFIYLVALSIALFGPTTLALRLPAAVVGALTTLPAWLLGRAWFGRAAGLLAAFLWAITLWPVHLGRIGLRAGLLAPLLALAFWLGTRAYREQRAALWFAAGLVYGLSFYTYLAVRFTPLLLALFAVYLVATGRRARLWDNGRALWFVGGAALVVAPLAVVLLRQPELLLGRAGQVSILSPEVNGGEPLRALLGNVGRALGLYLWRGDAILRHNALLSYDVVLKSDNPAGRPLFDLFMAGPFLVGLGWCVWRWRRPAAAFLLLWQLVMLGPTILAEDAPHFLRAAGILPGAVFFPAIGLALLWQWPRLPALLRRAAVILLLAGSLALTVRDYARYAQQLDVAYLWESAAAELANAAQATPPETAVYLDRRFVEGWPSVTFLLGDRPVMPFDAANPPATI